MWKRILVFLLLLEWAQPLTLSRRQALAQTVAATTSALVTSSASATTTPLIPPSSPLVTLSNGITIPRVGYSLYKTPAEQAGRGVQLALAAGVRHFDVAAQYGTNAQVGTVLRNYLQRGAAALNATRDELLVSISRSATKRHQELVVTHKVSNAQQALSATALRQELQQQAEILGKPIDLVMLHSPLSQNRLGAYATLCDYQARGGAKAVGVCHFSVAHLNELIRHSLPAPHVIQLELSPFNQHADVCAWATEHGSTVSCAAWSKLSGTTGPAAGWAQVAAVTQARGVTKQQVLIVWALQCGYLCVPRSSAQYKVERAAIRENAWTSVRDLMLTPEEMDLLNSLDEQYPAGKLGVTDGWEVSDIVDDKWDPTLLTT